MKKKSLRFLAAFMASAMVATSFPAYTLASPEPEEAVQADGEVLPAEEAEQEMPAASDSEEETVAPAQTAGDEPLITVTATKEVSFDSSLLPDSDELAEGYIESRFYQNSGVAALANSIAGEHLTGANQAFYTLLVDEICAVASGSASSTSFTFDGTDIFESTTFTAEELGVSEITPDTVLDLADQALSGQYDMHLFLDALVSDLPYELFWFDKGNGGIQESYRISYNSDYLTIPAFIIKMPVIPAYRGADRYTVNAAKLETVNTAVSNAQDVVASMESLDDLSILYGYRDYICNAVTYNHEAAAENYTGGYGDPWQLVYVFDEDPDTNVVCEGYSKAFQYLVDMTSFSQEGIYSILVSGTMNGGGHMWNILHMEDGNNYLVDVTNSDSLSVEDQIRRFMEIPDYGDALSGYVYEQETIETDTAYHTLPHTTYLYDASCLSLFGEEDLTLSDTEYVPGEDPGEDPGDDDDEYLDDGEMTLDETVYLPVHYENYYHRLTFTAPSTGDYIFYTEEDYVDMMGISLDAPEGEIAGTYTLTEGVCYEILVDVYESIDEIPLTISQYCGIIGQPEDVTAGIKTPITFHVDAVGAVSYQWQYTKDGKKWTTSSTATAKTDTVAITVSKTNYQNRYRCKVTFSDGNIQYSDLAGIEIIPWINIVSQPESPAMTLGETVNFHVEAENVKEGGYQWQYSKDGGASWFKSGATGATTDTLSIKVSKSNQVNMYRCLMTGIDGNTEKSAGAGFVVLDAQPQPSAAPVGTKATFSLKADGVTAYQWQFSDDGVKWYKSTAAGATTDTVSFTSTTNRTRVYRCVLTLTSGVTAYTKPVGYVEGINITGQPQSITASAGQKITFTVTATGASTYQWQYSKDGKSWTNSTAASAKTATLSTTAQTSYNGRQYRCILKDASGIQVISTSAKLTVK